MSVVIALVISAAIMMMVFLDFTADCAEEQQCADKINDQFHNQILPSKPQALPCRKLWGEALTGLTEAGTLLREPHAASRNQRRARGTKVAWLVRVIVCSS